ncbi:MAG TPA: sodium/proton-translocating pyrophosphatase, partial [Gemmatimonadaceae bacterium]|nr:sodium/proton-translocating pyrophosphatase [Gemmatimonadaceae bacterium]
MNATQSNLLGIVLGSSVAALLFAVWLARWVLARSRGTAEMQTISDAIQQGAEAFLARQYKTITALSLVVAVLIYVGYSQFRVSNVNDPVSSAGTLALYTTGA